MECCKYTIPIWSSSVFPGTPTLKFKVKELISDLEITIHAKYIKSCQIYILMFLFQDYCQLPDFNFCIFNEVEIMQK